MPLPASTVQARTAMADRIALARNEIHSEWRSPDRSLARLVALLSAAMVGAATDSAAASVAALVALDSGEPVARVDPASLGRSTSDGRSLASLLAYGAALQRLAPPEATAAWLDRVIVTQMGDAGRSAASLTVVATPGAGYVRAVRAGACSRCVILAGRVYRWGEAFDRHPLCLCTHIPVRENIAGDVMTDPRAYFDSLTEAEQDRTFTRAGAQAIRDGADPAKVVNARRGMTTAQPKVVKTYEREVFRFEVPGSPAFTVSNEFSEVSLGRRRLIRDSGGLYTTEEATLTRAARARLNLQPGQARLMPESIYELAENRSHAIRLLRDHGYLH